MDMLNGHPKWAQVGYKGKNLVWKTRFGSIVINLALKEKDQCLGDTFLPTIEIFALLTIFGGEVTLSVLCHRHDFQIVFYGLHQTTCW